MPIPINITVIRWSLVKSFWSCCNFENTTNAIHSFYAAHVAYAQSKNVIRRLTWRDFFSWMLSTWHENGHQHFPVPVTVLTANGQTLTLSNSNYSNETQTSLRIQMRHKRRSRTFASSSHLSFQTAHWNVTDVFPCNDLRVQICTKEHKYQTYSSGCMLPNQR